MLLLQSLNLIFFMMNFNQLIQFLMNSKSDITKAMRVCSSNTALSSYCVFRKCFVIVVCFPLQPNVDFIKYFVYKLRQWYNVMNIFCFCWMAPLCIYLSFTRLNIYVELSSLIVYIKEKSYTFYMPVVHFLPITIDKLNYVYERTRATSFL